MTLEFAVMPQHFREVLYNCYAMLVMSRTSSVYMAC